MEKLNNEKLDLIKTKINQYKKEDTTTFTQMETIINNKNEMEIKKQPEQLQLELEQ